MKVKTMIEQLEKMNPEAEVKLHHPEGDTALFVIALNCSMKNYSNVVFIEGKEDIDVGEELRAQLKHAQETQMQTAKFVKKLTDIGFSLSDVKEHIPEMYEYMKEVIKE